MVRCRDDETVPWRDFKTIAEGEIGRRTEGDYWKRWGLGVGEAERTVLSGVILFDVVYVKIWIFLSV